MVATPTEEDEAKLKDFMFDELAKLNNDYADRVVIFTKDGVPLFKRRKVTETDGVPGWDERTWADALWHLHEVYDGTKGVY